MIVDETRTSDTTVTLQSRSNFENKNKYHYCISFHRNAYKPEQASGVETFTYIEQDVKSKSIPEKLQAALVGLGFTNRGVKKENFHVLRETKASAVLVELGFIDSSKDNNLFDAKRREVIKVISKTILSEVGIVYKEEVRSKPNIPKTLYIVMSGSYAIRKNAEKQVNKLKAAGFDATVMISN